MIHPEETAVVKKDSVLTITEVMAKLRRKSRQSIYNLLAQPGSTMPPPFRIGDTGPLLWSARAIDEYVEREMARRRLQPSGCRAAA